MDDAGSAGRESDPPVTPGLVCCHHGWGPWAQREPSLSPPHLPTPSPTQGAPRVRPQPLDHCLAGPLNPTSSTGWSRQSLADRDAGVGLPLEPEGLLEWGVG